MSELATILLKWLERISLISPPNPEIKAFNFGIFQTQNGYSVYLIGSTKYDSEDDDWACMEDYAPVERYLELPLTANGDWQSVETGLVEALREIVSAVPSFLNNAEYVTAGFDDVVLVRVK
jgi:hypothetical protein